MKMLLMAIVSACLFPLAACESTHVQSSKTNWDGSHTTTDTTVTTNDITGGTTVDQTKTTTR